MTRVFVMVKVEFECSSGLTWLDPINEKRGVGSFKTTHKNKNKNMFFCEKTFSF